MARRAPRSPFTRCARASPTTSERSSSARIRRTLGDLHNLFGDTHAVHVRVDGERWVIEDLVKGDSVNEVLRYMQHDPGKFARDMERDCENAVQRGELSVAESRDILRFYHEGLAGYTYLEGE